MAGPFREPPFPNLHVSPLGLVPKKEAGKFHLIHHLSFPSGESVNDGISKEQAAVSYTSFDRALCLWTKNITLLEFFPLVVALEVWGTDLVDRRIYFWSDNAAVVQVINKQSSYSSTVLA
ncbi:hypothetical protein GDO78_021355 [Eleutherodactylus coqui]|uniref:Uncharacterized protein n=1 Tax=Eleutherodactylus coqui TaxID=57060 RepID=A0A8J6BHG4_ELECQ|nr:hypothetical protein GDO78_021355 [Eleutherodactylus coqui]